MAEDTKMLMIEGARLVYRNFAGKETLYKPAGTRTFSVVLEKDLADRLAEDGWNVKCKIRGEEDDPEEFCHIEVAVNFKHRPPKIVVITESGRTPLTEDTVEMLDYADILNVDLICNPYNWEVGGKTGLKPYLKSMFVTIDEDPLERKYAVRDAE